MYRYRFKTFKINLSKYVFFKDLKYDHFTVLFINGIKIIKKIKLVSLNKLK